MVVLITGANRGLGLALAEEFVSSGFRLVLHCRSMPENPPLCFSNSTVVVGDLTEDETLFRLAAEPVDILVNNAGIHMAEPFLNYTWLEICELVRVNLVVPMILTRLHWSSLKMVVNINSLASKGGGPWESIYAASKAGLAGFSETLQFDATRAGIRVLNVNLGGMNTDMAEGRNDRDKFIEPIDAAKAIFNLCQNYQTLRVTSVDLKRSRY